MPPSATPEQRIAALERTIADLADKLDPQTLRTALERTWNPRGTADVPRVVGAAGNTIGKPSPRLQFPGAAVLFDPKTQSNVVFTGGAVALDFSADSNTTDLERIKFKSQVAPGVDVARIDTSTGGAAGEPRPVTVWRHGGADVAATSDADMPGLLKFGTEYPGIGLFDLSLKAPFSTNRHTLSIKNESANFQLQAPGGGWSGSNTMTLGVKTTAGVEGGISITRGSNTFASFAMKLGDYSGLTATTPHLVVAGMDFNTPAGSLIVSVGGFDRTLLDAEFRANYVQATSDTASLVPVRRVSRGPFTAAPGALAAGASAVVTVAGVRVGTDSVVEGGLKGPSGVEDLSWSWADGPLANEVTITFKNNHPTLDRTAILHFRCTSSS